MINLFNIDNLKNKLVNPLIGLESISTDFVTNSILGNKTYRYNFYVLIQIFFNRFRDSLLVNKYSEYKKHIYLMFKGGNIIKSVIDLSEQNLLKADDYSLDKFSKTKRSDYDFSIVIDYDKISENYMGDKKRLLLEITMLCEKIAYNILREFQKCYDYDTESITLNDKKVQITNLSENIENFPQLAEEYKKGYEELIGSTFSKNIYDEYRTSTKNFVNNLFLILSKIAGKEVGAEQMPELQGFIINDKNKYNTEQITEKNCVSVNALLNASTGTREIISKKRILSSAHDNIEIYYSNNDLPLLAEDDDFKNIEETKKLTGYSVDDEKIDNKILFEKLNKPDDIKYSKYDVTHTTVKVYPNNSSLYISSNRALRFFKKNAITTFNLIRMKYNIRLFFKLKTPIRYIEYVYIDLPGEFIDISIATWVDSALTEMLPHLDKYLISRSLYAEDKEGKRFDQQIYTYSTFGLIHDIEKILFADSGNMPWTDQKYSKRLERLFRLYFAYVKDSSIVKDNIKNILTSSNALLIAVKNLYVEYKINKKRNVIDIIDGIINIANTTLAITTDNLKPKTVGDDSEELLKLFDGIKKPLKTFNDKNDISDIDSLINYLDDCIKYYTIFIENITQPSIGNLQNIQLGGVYKKYLKYKTKYLNLKLGSDRK